jgi:YHS domain-containing protein
MKTLSLITAVMGLILAGSVSAAGEALKAQTVCPVMGGKIDSNSYTDFQGQRIYHCCDACKATFKKDPEKYFKKIADEKILLENIQEKCPVMGGKINKESFIDYKGRRIYMCCDGCKAGFNENPAKYLAKLPGKHAGKKSGHEKGHKGHEHHDHGKHKGHDHGDHKGHKH